MSRWGRIFVVLLFLPVFGVVVVILWWWLARRYGKMTVAQPVMKIPIPLEDVEETPPPSQVHLEQPDDLQRIEGIGPKISAVLMQVGITTYVHLAEADVTRLKQILNESGIRAAADTWPEQAKLAAAGDWEGLKALQETLKGGRRA